MSDDEYQNPADWRGPSGYDVRAELARQATDEKAKLREQRRYEIARDCLASFVGNGEDPDSLLDAVTECVRLADALLAALEKP